MVKMYRVYSVIERPKQEDFWLNIGMAYAHDKGEGFNIVLQALPLHGNGKLVMQAYDPKAPVPRKANRSSTPGTRNADARYAPIR
jgi:hypothetical protein